jgi:CRISPR-associated protein Cas2
VSLHRHLYLAAYDIRCDRRRAAALKRLRGHATGGQKSVHEVWLTSSEKVGLLADMPALLAETDRFCLLRLDPRSRSHALGAAEAPADPDYFDVG